MRKTLSIDRRTKEEKCNDWLHSFPVFQDHVLMAVGIVHQIKVEYDKAQTLGFPFKSVRLQLRGRVNKLWYKNLILKTGGMRYNLDGTEYGYQPVLPNLKKLKAESETPLAKKREGA